MTCWPCLLGLSTLAGCFLPARPPASLPDPNSGYPRCLASDAYGNQIACQAPPRAYNGDGCACGDGLGHVLYGRVEEYPTR